MLIHMDCEKEKLEFYQADENGLVCDFISIDV